MLFWLFSIPGWLFDITGKLSFRSAQWLGLFAVSLAVCAIWRQGFAGRIKPLWLLPLAPLLADFLLHPGAHPLLAMGGWAAFVVLIHIRGVNAGAHVAATRGVLAAAGASVVLLLLQAVNWDPLFHVGSWVSGARIREYGTAGLTGFLGNAGDAGLFLALSMTLVPLAEISRKGIWSTYAALFVGIVVTGARLPLLMASVFLIFQLPKHFRWWVPVLVFALSMAYTPLRYKTLGGLERGRITQQLANRFGEWGIAATLIGEQSPWTLRGTGTYGQASAAQRFESGKPVSIRHGWYRQAHSDYLQSVVELGWLGVLCFGIALLPWLRALATRRTPAAAFLMFATAMLFLFPVHLAPAVLVLALASGMPPDQNGNVEPRLRYGPMAVLGVVLGVALALAGADWWALQRNAVVPSPIAYYPEAAPRARVLQAQAELQKSGRVSEANLQEILADEPNPWAAAQLAALRMQGGDAAGAVKTACYAFAATGHPNLAAWLVHYRAHVTNLASADARLRPCILLQ